MHSGRLVVCLGAMLAAGCASGVTGSGAVTASAAEVARGLDCSFLTEAEAAASAGVPNVTHAGVRLDPQPPPSTDPNDAIAQRANIPRSAQPPLTASQQRILMCGYELDAANARMPFSLFVPEGYDPAKSWPLIVDLHGAGVTPLQQMLFDGTTDFAQRDGYIVLAPMGFSTFGGWGPARGTPVPVETADVNAETRAKWTTNALSEHDALTVLSMVRDKFNVDADRIYLMGHSMGGFGTFFLGAKHNHLWAGIAPIAGGGVGPNAPAEKLKGVPVLVMHGAEDNVVNKMSSRASVRELQKVGAQHVYLEFPGLEHEFFIRRGRENLEKVFHFFNLVSRKTNVGPIPDAAAQ
jgi:poly(3-hydroxybutyrate) depolymerase